MTLEINYKKKTVKFTNMWRLNNATEQSVGQKRNQKRDFKKYLEINENGSTTSPNVRSTAKAVLRGNSIAINAYSKKKERLEKQHYSTPQRTRKNKKRANEVQSY